MQCSGQLLSSVMLERERPNLIPQKGGEQSRNKACKCSFLLLQFINIMPSLDFYKADRSAPLVKVLWKDTKCFIFATYQFKCTCQQAQSTIFIFSSYNSLSTKVIHTFAWFSSYVTCFMSWTGSWMTSLFIKILCFYSRFNNGMQFHNSIRSSLKQ